MSQSATLYRVSKETLTKLLKSDGISNFTISDAKDYITFAGTHMGLQYLLSTDQNLTDRQLVEELFNPPNNVYEAQMKSMPIEEFYEKYDIGIPYLTPEAILKIHQLLAPIKSPQILARYNAKELNDNDIYPSRWQESDELDAAFTGKELAGDFHQLKEIVRQAQEENDFIFVFIG